MQIQGITLNKVKSCGTFWAREGRVCGVSWTWVFRRKVPSEDIHEWRHSWHSV